MKKSSAHGIHYSEVNASPSLTRPGTMRLIRSNAKPNLLKAEKNKRKRKAAAEEKENNRLVITSNNNFNHNIIYFYNQKIRIQETIIYRVLFFV
ncbi:hypothetical protein RIR_jg38929.t1 [Rhizophagus irregularis DAOM 181602=DAOM 197198]|nr:hypothetical protein RIR_jg38929.t1 [Rhizophagus irregularis DAOM 181602=DAOM 197198]